MKTSNNIKLEFREYKLSDDFPVLVLSPGNQAPPYNDNSYANTSHIDISYADTSYTGTLNQPPSYQDLSQKYHFHNCIEIGFCYENEHLLSFEDRTYRLKAGDFFVLSPYSMHYVNHASAETTKCCEYLYIKPAKLLHDFYTFDIPEDMYWYKNSEVPFVFSKDEHGEIYELLMLLLSEYNFKKDEYQLMIKGLVQTLMVELTRELASLATPDSDKYRSISMLLPALKQIDFNFGQPLNTELLAEECNLRPAAFRTLFLEHIGETPVMYLRRIRLKKACELLYSTELSVLNIAMEVGFPSLTNFYSSFHECYQISPKKWREKYRSIQKKSIIHSLYSPER